MKPATIGSKPSQTVSASRPSVAPRKILPLGDPPPQSATTAAHSLSGGPMTIGKQVLRVNRACNACRKQKMRCEGPECPPCARCKTTGQPCVFEKVQKSDGSDTNSLRIADLEYKWSTIEGTLGDVLRELRDVKSSLSRSRPGSSGGLSLHIAASPTPSSPHDVGGPTFSPVTEASPPATHFGQSVTFHPHPRSLKPLPSGSQLPPIDQIYNGTRIDSPSGNHRAVPHFLSGNRIDAPMTHNTSFNRRSSYLTPMNGRRRMTSSSNLYSANNSGDEDDLPNAALAAPISVVNDIASAHPITSDEDASMGSNSAADADDRASTSPDPRRRREKRKRRDSSVIDSSRPRPRTSEAWSRDFDASDMAFSKKGNHIGDGYSMSSVASVSTAARSKRRRTPDVVARGFLSETDALALYQIYFSGCHRLLAVFDPSVDTFESIKQRSPFLFCSLLMVGAKVRDGPTVSELQAQLLHEATELAKDRVFESKGRVEDVQALLLLAGWSHSMGGVGWLTAGHAIRLAVELGIHKALQRLEKVVKADDTEPETHRPLITAARTWLALYVFEYQISFGTGRPAMMRGDTAITKGKDILLSHPLSIPTDARLVSTCELLTRQNTIHQKLEACLAQGDDNAVHQTLQDATADIDSWLDEWDVRMSSFDQGAVSVLDCLFDRRVLGPSQPAAGFFRSSAAIQRAYANLFHNCIALRGLRTAADAQSMSLEMRSIALQAIQSAKECIDICLNNAEYRQGLKYAVAYTHTCAAFAGAFLLRFARLFPADVDMGETTQMVDALAGVLSEVPAISFGVWLRKMLNHTQQRARYGQQQSGLDKDTRESEGISQPQRAVDVESPVDIPMAIPPPPPPIQLPNSQPFVPLSASASLMTGGPYSTMMQAPLQRHANESASRENGHHHAILHDSTLRMNGGNATLSDISFNDSAASMLQGFIGDGHEWPPWLTTSMVGDLDPTNPSTGGTDLSFVWNPSM